MLTSTDIYIISFICFVIPGVKKSRVCFRSHILYMIYRRDG